MVAAAPGPLSASNEELSASGPQSGCSRWPKRHWLLAASGYLVRGRCGSSNLCEYCLMQELHVIRRALSLDAIETERPEVVAVFGTRTPTLDPAPFYRARSEAMRALKREFPDARYACLSEFTTGKGTNAGGLRRPHWNMLLKGVPADGAAAARELMVPPWCHHVDALPVAQYVEPLRNDAAFMRYVADHFTKTSQQPPRDSRWKHKQRFNCSRDYYSPLTRAEARERAWWHLQHEREVVKAHKSGAADPLAAADERIEELRNETWTMYDPARVQPAPELVRVMHRASVNLKRWEAMVSE